ncbi:S8 family serine peptidase [Flammeovirga sp. MY04]|uniref:S8 family serine peptidase n=1 Tax=Flammeovirga sp. MY04 TaxID=1191459 RepID=UPI000827203B|nr:S8 family serine peptidase [Flammeovirga sp. MY04]ANQ49770.2 S8 family serine peptidase [Flammeovirga sp. MY04]
MTIRLAKQLKKNYTTAKNHILLLSLLACFVVSYPSFSSNKERVWVVFHDKCENSPLDFFNQKVCNEYLNQLKLMGFEPQTVSNWLNAVTIELSDKSDRELLENSAFIQDIKTVRADLELGTCQWLSCENDKQQSAYVIHQLNTKELVDNGVHGQNIRIGVIDAGFWNAQKNDYLKGLFQNNQIKGYKDFFIDDRSETSFFNEKLTGSDSHGTTVLRMIAGNHENMRYGLAHKSEFYLARSDHGDKENKTDEENWIAALEWMVDSLDIKLINSSLGYSIGFDSSKDNYKKDEMDGKTSMVTLAAEIASKKGALIIVSAGNEGDNERWRIVSAPADAKSVLSVGANTKSGKKAGYSSIGPTYINYVKPEVTCYSLFGTSFSAPVITGLAACLWEMDPSLTGQELKDIIIKSSTFYPYGNNYTGYGVPDAQKAMSILKGGEVKSSSTIIDAKGEKRLKIDAQDGEHSMAVAFHKKNDFVVIKQEVVYLEKEKFKIKRLNNESSTTVWTGKRHIEIIW